MTAGRRTFCRSLGLALAAGLVCGTAVAQKHTAVSVKPGAPLAISVEVPPVPMPGVAFAVRIGITATADLTDVQLTLTAGDGVAVTPGAFGIGALVRGATWTGTVDMLPLEAGRHRLVLFVTAESPVFGPVARSVAKPIAVGAAAATSAGAASSRAAAAGETSADPAAAGDRDDVEHLRRMPAAETVR